MMIGIGMPSNQRRMPRPISRLHCLKDNGAGSSGFRHRSGAWSERAIAAGHEEEYRADTQLEASECFFGWGGCVMVGQTAGHSTAGAEPKTADSGKAQRRAAADKIKKMIRKCKADTKAIRQLDDEQLEYLKRLRKQP
jgi:hypothetical protein